MKTKSKGKTKRVTTGPKIEAFTIALLEQAGFPVPCSLQGEIEMTIII